MLSARVTPSLFAGTQITNAHGKGKNAMARIRSVKPQFFKHYPLYKAEITHKLPLRIAFEALWTQADREGRFRWRPEELKIECLPYDPVSFDNVLNILVEEGFIKKYEVDGHPYGWIPTWHSHQVPNTREADSTIPPDPSLCNETCASMCKHVHTRARHARASVEQEQEREQEQEHKKHTLAQGGELIVFPNQKAGYRFEEFWEPYPNKQNKKRAQQTWVKLCLDEMADEIIADVYTRKASHEQWLRDGGKYIPHPTTYLNGERWKDEIQEVTHASSQKPIESIMQKARRERDAVRAKQQQEAAGLLENIAR